MRSADLLIFFVLSQASQHSLAAQSTQPMLSRYEAAVRRLYQVNVWQPVKLGLRNIEALDKLMESPLASKPIVHVAGTNGKGSVAWKIARSLREAGYKDGLFVSPHVSSFRERIEIGGIPISEADVATKLPWLFDMCEKENIPATFFELTTALAFEHFKSADVVVLEVGLGGRLDATNIITPALSVITSIGLDHTHILGSTVEEIALEKAGIMKTGIPVVVGPRVPRVVLALKAAEVGSPFHEATTLAGIDPSSEALDDYDEENTMVGNHVAVQRRHRPMCSIRNSKSTLSRR
jgi:dihydrofolate synthase/folylpolyglutamate synthase